MAVPKFLSSASPAPKSSRYVPDCVKVIRTWDRYSTCHMGVVGRLGSGGGADVEVLLLLVVVVDIVVFWIAAFVSTHKTCSVLMICKFHPV